MKEQRGGTFVGFVIGVVVGLGAALAVAVYITKVPVPFINKGQSRSADQDAAETKKNKGWDPNDNELLRGKNPARPATAAASAAEDGAVAPSAGSQSAAPGAAAPRAEAKPALASDPLGDLVKAKAAGADLDSFVYFVQVGAFRTPEDAEGHRAKLSLSGIEAKVSERDQSGRMVYRVRVGPFDKKDEADKAKEKLDGAGLDTAMVRVQR
jgi:cell division protein FtsN